MREDTPAQHHPQLLQPGGDGNQAQPLSAGPSTPAAPPFQAQLSLAFQATATGLDSLAIAEQPHIRARRSQAVLPKGGLEAQRGACRQALVAQQVHGRRGSKDRSSCQCWPGLLGMGSGSGREGRKDKQLSDWGARISSSPHPHLSPEAFPGPLPASRGPSAFLSPQGLPESSPFCCLRPSPYRSLPFLAAASASPRLESRTWGRGEVCVGPANLLAVRLPSP